jgi:hypothetical protein
MAGIVFTPFAYIQYNRVLVIDELNRYQRIHLLARRAAQQWPQQHPAARQGSHNQHNIILQE